MSIPRNQQTDRTVGSPLEQKAKKHTTTHNPIFEGGAKSMGGQRTRRPHHEQQEKPERVVWGGRHEGETSQIQTRWEDGIRIREVTARCHKGGAGTLLKREKKYGKSLISAPKRGDSNSSGGESTPCDAGKRRGSPAGRKVKAALRRKKYCAEPTFESAGGRGGTARQGIAPSRPKGKKGKTGGETPDFEKTDRPARYPNDISQKKHPVAGKR